MPPDTEKKLQKLEDLFKMVNDSLTREEFLDAFKEVINQVNIIKEQLFKEQENKIYTTVQTLKELETLHKQTIAKIEEENKTGLYNLKKWAIEQVNNFFIKSETNKRLKEIESAHTLKMKEIDKRLASIRDGTDGEDGYTPTEEELLALIARIMPTLPEIKDYTEDIEEIKEQHETMYKDIEELKNRPQPLGRGGGHTDMGVKFSLGRLVKTETPSGDIDGANTAYTTTQPIQAIFSFMIRGEVIPSGDYSYVGNTITFTTALPAAYSGSDFEIVYI